MFSTLEPDNRGIRQVRWGWSGGGWVDRMFECTFRRSREQSWM